MNVRVFLLLLPFSLFLPGHVGANEWTGNLNAFFGGKALDDNDWMADEQAQVGVRLDFRRQDWPISLAADVHYSEGDFAGNVFFPGVGVRYYREDVETSELNFGVRKYWITATNMRPFFGGGMAFVLVDAKGNADGDRIFSEKGDGVGLWINGGISWTLNALNIGFDLRYSQAEVDMDFGDVEGGGGHAGMLLGYHW